MQPFLLISIRGEDVAADDERAAFLRGTGLSEDQLRWHRLDRDPLPDLDLDEWSGIILGGGPYNFSDVTKSPDQIRAEADLYRLLDRVVAADFPFFGACYGVGVVGSHQGGVIDRTYSEPIGRVPITLTAEGRTDPLFGALPETFDAFLGHKEAIATLPAHAVHLASSAACPVQGFRIGSNVYVTQFHPELDSEGLCLRVDVYQDYGYFDPSEVADLHAMARAQSVDHPQELLAGFVRRYAR